MNGPLPGAALRPAVFLDRDGTINRDDGFVHRPQDLQFLPGAVTALARLKRAGFLLVVVTNQSGVARGHFSEADVIAFHGHMNEQLTLSEAAIDAFYYCPHHVDASVDAYRQVSRSRKPEIGMFEQACRDWPIDTARSYMIGDRTTDVEFGTRASLETFLVRGSSAEETPLESAQRYRVVTSLSEAANIILHEATAALASR